MDNYKTVVIIGKGLPNYLINIMPLIKGSSKKVINKNIRELYADNKKSGKGKGANGKLRSKKQIVAIALSLAKKSKKK